MKPPRTWRLAIRREPYRGLWPPDRPGGGFLVLDRNPWAVPHYAVSILAVLGCAPAGLFLLVAFSALLSLSPATAAVAAFLLVFTLGWLHLLARAVLGRERLWIGPSGLGYLWTDGLVRSRGMIPHGEIRRLTPYSVIVRNRDSTGTPHTEYGVAIETFGESLCVGQSRDPDTVDLLRDEILRGLLGWHPTWAEAPQAPNCETLDSAGMHAEPPSDSSLACRREWDRTEFLLSAPARRRWAIRPGEIRTSIPGLGFLWSRTTEIEWLDRIELRRAPSMMPWVSTFELALVDMDGIDKAVFGPLTEGEARWMAGIVADVLKDALPRSGQEIYRWSVAVDGPTAGSRAMADEWLDGPGSKTSPNRVDPAS